MKINQSNNIAFGYNRAYHDKVIQKLENLSRNSQISRVLLSLEKTSIAIEDSIIDMENSCNGTYDDSYQILADFLTKFKISLADYMNQYYPNLNYYQQVIDEYEDEIDECVAAEEQYWRQDICHYLSYIPMVEDDFENTSQDDNVQDNTQNNIPSKETNVKTKEDDVDISELISEYCPQSNSPKGFNDIVGLEKTKAALQEEIIDYIENPELKKLDKLEYGIEPCATMLFYGPPGCGKTYITEALASQSGLKMFKMDISKIGSKYVNQTSANIQKAFDYIEKVAENEKKPVLLFMDELDSLAIKRESSSGGSGENLKTTSTLLKLIQEAKDKNIIIIGATNRRNIVDSALLDRFGTETYFGLSDENGIANLLKAKLGKISKGKKLSEDEESLQELSKELLGYSNRSIVHIFEKASKLAKRNSRSDITIDIIRQAVKDCDFEKINEKLYKKESSNKIGFGFIS